MKRTTLGGNFIKGRLESCNDLVAEEAIYTKCMSKFLKVEGKFSQVGRYGKECCFHKSM